MDKSTCIINKSLIETGDKIVVGVSGGADSMALLYSLMTLRDTCNVEVVVAHVEHQFRGQASLDDMAFVVDYCERNDVKCVAKSVDVEGLSQKMGLSFEEAGRFVRYELFYQVLKTYGYNKIAVAQNLDDQAETVLMRLFRGSGIDGLSGIKEIRDDVIIRPLLDTSRQHIDEYCQIHDLKPRHDQTNDETIYTRNKIRLELIPYIEAHFNPNVKVSIHKTAKLLSEDYDYLKQRVAIEFDSLFKRLHGSYSVELEAFNQRHMAIRRKLMRHVIESLKGNLKNVSYAQIDQLIELATDRRTGKRIVIGKIEFIVDYDKLVCRFYEPCLKENFEFQVSVKSLLKAPLKLNQGMFDSIEAVLVSKESLANFKLASNQKYAVFDDRCLDELLVVRNRKNGDKFQPSGMTGRKKLKQFFIDQKISKELRDEVPLVCINDTIIWVMGYRQSEKCRYDGNRDNALVLVATMGY